MSTSEMYVELQAARGEAEALRRSLEEVRAERDEWKVRFESAWDDMRVVVAAGPEATTAVLRRSLEWALDFIDREANAPGLGSRDAVLHDLALELLREAS